MHQSFINLFELTLLNKKKTGHATITDHGQPLDPNSMKNQKYQNSVQRTNRPFGVIKCSKGWFCCCWFIVALIVCRFFLFGPSIVMHYLLSFLVLQSSRWGSESWLLYFNCLLDVTRLSYTWSLTFLYKLDLFPVYINLLLQCVVALLLYSYHY